MSKNLCQLRALLNVDLDEGVKTCRWDRALPLSIPPTQSQATLSQSQAISIYHDLMLLAWRPGDPETRADKFSSRSADARFGDGSPNTVKAFRGGGDAASGGSRAAGRMPDSFADSSMHRNCGSLWLRDFSPVPWSAGAIRGRCRCTVAYISCV